jgi:hypothetical protein
MGKLAVAERKVHLTNQMRPFNRWMSARQNTLAAGDLSSLIKLGTHELISS